MGSGQIDFSMFKHEQQKQHLDHSFPFFFYLFLFLFFFVFFFYFKKSTPDLCAMLTENLQRAVRVYSRVDMAWVPNAGLAEVNARKGPFRVTVTTAPAAVEAAVAIKRLRGPDAQPDAPAAALREIAKVDTKGWKTKGAQA